jgi:tight adherence protein B
MSIWVTALLVFTATAFGTLSIALLWELLSNWRRNRQVAKRLKPVIGGHAMDDDLDLVRSFEDPDNRLADLRLPGVRLTENLLAQARLDWKPEPFLFATFGMTLAAGAAVLVLTGSLVLAWLAALAGGFAPFQYARSRRARRFRDFEEQFPEAIDLLTRAIRAGHPLTSGVQMVGAEGPLAVADEFRQMFEEHRFGIPFEDALLGFVDRLNTVDVRIFAIAILVQREVGGNLAEILDNLADTIRGRFYIRRQLRVYTAQGRMSGYVLAALPIVVGVAMFLLEPEYLMLLFSTLVGWLLVATAAVLQIFGYLWIRKIVNIDI